MSKQKVDEFYNASPTPEEDSTQEDVITVEVSRETLTLLKQLEHLRKVATTQVENKTEATVFSATSPYTPTKSSTGENVANEEIESLIHHSRNVLSSGCKNTDLGDTRYKGSPADANGSSDMEKSLVDSAIEGHRDGAKSNQDSPVSVKDTPGEAAPFKRVHHKTSHESTIDSNSSAQSDCPSGN